MSGKLTKKESELLRGRIGRQLNFAQRKVLTRCGDETLLGPYDDNLGKGFRMREQFNSSSTEESETFDYDSISKMNFTELKQKVLLTSPEYSDSKKSAIAEKCFSIIKEPKSKRYVCLPLALGII